MITLALMGDVMLGRNVAEALDRHLRREEPWGDVMPLLDAADLRIINLECAITYNERPEGRSSGRCSTERTGRMVRRWPSSPLPRVALTGLDSRIGGVGRGNTRSPCRVRTPARKIRARFRGYKHT